MYITYCRFTKYHVYTIFSTRRVGLESDRRVGLERDRKWDWSRISQKKKITKMFPGSHSYIHGQS